MIKNTYFPDSPVWLRQQAQSGLVQSPTTLRPSSRLHEKHQPNDVQMWEILEVSAEDKMTYATNLSTDRNEAISAQQYDDMVVTAERDYTFNYDHLDNVDNRSSTIVLHNDPVVDASLSAVIAPIDCSRFTAIITKGSQQKLTFVRASASTMSLIGLRTFSKSDTEVNSMRFITVPSNSDNVIKHKSCSIDVFSRTSEFDVYSKSHKRNNNASDQPDHNVKSMLAYQRNVSLSHSDISCMKSLS